MWDSFTAWLDAPVPTGFVILGFVVVIYGIHGVERKLGNISEQLWKMQHPEDRDD